MKSRVHTEFIASFNHGKHGSPPKAGHGSGYERIARASLSREANSPSETEGVAARPGEYDLAVENMENV